jgi:hypothetical protein
VAGTGLAPRFGTDAQALARSIGNRRLARPNRVALRRFISVSSLFDAGFAFV